MAVKGGRWTCPPDTQEEKVAWTGVMTLEVKRGRQIFTLLEVEHPGLADGCDVEIPTLSIPVVPPLL